MSLRGDDRRVLVTSLLLERSEMSHPWSMPQLTLRLLGAFEASVDGRSVPAHAWPSRRAVQLVALLALAPGRTLHRDQVAEALWPHLSPDAAAANLRKAAHYARRALGTEGAVVLREGLVALLPGGSLEVDVDRFAAEANASLQTGSAERCAEVAGRYTGELLPHERYEDWPEPARARLRSLYLGLLRAAELWERVIAEEPADEVAHAALIRAHRDAGNRPAALAQYQQLSVELAALGLEPSAETAALNREVAQAPLAASPIRYVRRDGVSIAYQVVEGGSADLLLIPGWVSHLALDWEEPHWVRWCERMTRFARLVRFDKRGTGLSDRPPGVQPLAARMEDAHEVLDAAGVEQAHVLGWSEGGPLAMLLAATHPERVLSLVLYGTQACSRRSPDYPWGVSEEDAEQVSQQLEREWGSTALAREFAPRADDAFFERNARYLRAGASPSAAAALNRANAAIDVRALLPHIDVPTLVVSRNHDPFGQPEAGRYMADRIAGARFVELDGEDHIMWLGNTETLCGEIERFVLDVDSATHVRTKRDPRIRARM